MVSRIEIYSVRLFYLGKGEIMESIIKKYKQLSCWDAGGSCDFLAQAQTEEQVMKITANHRCISHGICKGSPENEIRIKSLIRSTWNYGPEEF
jgi:predicted small metal-binding protein